MCSSAPLGKANALVSAFLVLKSLSSTYYLSDQGQKQLHISFLICKMGNNCTLLSRYVQMVCGKDLAYYCHTKGV